MEENLILEANDIITGSDCIQALIMKVSDEHFRLFDIEQLYEIKLETDEPLYLDISKNSEEVQNLLYDYFGGIMVIYNLDDHEFENWGSTSLVDWVKEANNDYRSDYFLNEKGERVVIALEPTSENEFIITEFNLDKHCLGFVKNQDNYQDLKNLNYSELQTFITIW